MSPAASLSYCRQLLPQLATMYKSISSACKSMIGTANGRRCYIVLCKVCFLQSLTKRWLLSLSCLGRPACPAPACQTLPSTPELHFFTVSHQATVDVAVPALSRALDHTLLPGIVKQAASINNRPSLQCSLTNNDGRSSSTGVSQQLCHESRSPSKTSSQQDTALRKAMQ